MGSEPDQARCNSGPVYRRVFTHTTTRRWGPVPHPTRLDSTVGSVRLSPPTSVVRADLDVGMTSSIPVCVENGHRRPVVEWCNSTTGDSGPSGGANRIDRSRVT